MGYMDGFTFVVGELSKHKVSQRECLEMLSSKSRREFDLPDSRRGNGRYMAVGFTHEGRLLEAGIELRGEVIHIFHAMTATKEYRRMYAGK
jgi:uncharacterized DUF497 family protein